MTKAPTGSLHRGLTADGAVRFLAVEAKRLVHQTGTAHGLSGAAARTAGEATIAALLMSAWIKGEERITLQIQGEEPRFAYMGEADAAGNLRARMTPARLRPREGQHINGLMMAIKADGRRELYRGMTPLEDQTIERALVEHLSNSDQVDTLLRIQVKLDDDGAVRTAGGLLLERLPDHPDHASMAPDEFQAEFGSIPDQDIGELHTALAFGSIAGRPIELLENRVLTWRCRCSDMKVRSMLRSLGATELASIRDELGQAEVTCHFCNQSRVVDA
ncbi:MAG: Hsp33 family molecular chaperone HslO, partial [Myxococcota bacterium]|nr:Hsp33 family molecular chaperone HslO [Myxococcota bacterium]